MPVLIEHRLRLGDRAVTLLEGPGGWGECSPLAGFPSDPDRCRRAAETAARDGFPRAVRSEVPVNALVDGPFLVESIRGYPAVKVKVRDASGVALVAAVREAVGPTVALRVDANGAWDVDTAATMITRLARYDLEYVEQPVAQLDDLARGPTPRRGTDRSRRVHPIDRRCTSVASARRRRCGGAQAATPRRRPRRTRHRRRVGVACSGELDAGDFGGSRGGGCARGRPPGASVRMRAGDAGRAAGRRDP